MHSWSSPFGGSAKTATRFETPLCTTSAASSAPAPPESSDKTMMSADATGSVTTSAHPAARRTGSRRERIATIANAPNASTTRIEAHLGHLKVILGFIRSLHAIPPREPDFPYSGSYGLATRRPLAPHVDGGRIEGGLDVRRIEFLDHLDTGAAVLGDLVDVRAFHQA